MPEIQPAVPVGRMPNADNVLERLGMDPNQPRADDYRRLYATIVSVVLNWLENALSLPMPARIIQAERVVVSGRTRLALTTWWPVTAITKCFLGSSQTALKVGKLIDIARGTVDVAIAEDGAGLRYGLVIAAAAPAELYVDYQAGFDELPAELFEVVIEAALMVGKEKDRVGLKNVKVDLGMQGFTRQLPDWCQMTMNRYRRAALYV